MSSMLKKLITALRGGVNEVGEGIIDAQAIRILEQQLRDSSEELQQARRDLAALMGESARLSAQIDEQSDEIARRTRQVRQAQAADQQDLARELAQKILDHQRIRTQHGRNREGLDQRIDALRQRVIDAERQLGDFQRELRVARTNERVLKATETIDTRLLSQRSSLASAKETLERLQDHQLHEEARHHAAVTLDQSLAGEDLDARLRHAGIDEQQEAVDRLLAEIGGQSDPCSTDQ